jgi:hypothetical protein
MFGGFRTYATKMAEVRKAKKLQTETQDLIEFL